MKIAVLTSVVLGHIVVVAGRVHSALVGTPSLLGLTLIAGFAFAGGLWLALLIGVMGDAA